jgi:hypothetical protein
MQAQPTLSISVPCSGSYPKIISGPYQARGPAMAAEKWFGDA